MTCVIDFTDLSKSANSTFNFLNSFFYFLLYFLKPSFTLIISKYNFEYKKPINIKSMGIDWEPYINILPEAIFLVNFCQIYLAHHFYFYFCYMTILHFLFSKEAVVRGCSVEKVFLKSFAIFTGKHLCRGLFLVKLQA